jgi:hypothetical protein
MHMEMHILLRAIRGPFDLFPGRSNLGPTSGGVLAVQTAKGFRPGVPEYAEFDSTARVTRSGVCRPRPTWLSVRLPRQLQYS